MLKPVGGTVAVLLTFVLAVPVLATGGAPPAPSCVAGFVLEVALRTTRTLESGGRYDLPPGPGGASGAYQYLGSTWRHWASASGVDTVPYPEAYLAPPLVQDAVASAHMTAVVQDTGDVSVIPLAWYWPGAITRPEELDRVPASAAGNRLTVRAYRDRWLRLYAAEETNAEGCLPTPTPDGWALPVNREVLDPDPMVLGRPHHDYPAVDIPVAVGTAVFALRGGTVSAVSGELTPCGIGVTVDSDDGSRWRYCHGSAVHVAPGQEVSAGQLVLTSGDSGRSTGPHLHLEIAVGLRRRCAQRLLLALYTDGRGVDATSLPTVGCVA